MNKLVQIRIIQEVGLQSIFSPPISPKIENSNRPSVLLTPNQNVTLIVQNSGRQSPTNMNSTSGFPTHSRSKSQNINEEQPQVASKDPVQLQITLRHHLDGVRDAYFFNNTRIQKIILFISYYISFFSFSAYVFFCLAQIFFSLVPILFFFSSTFFDLPLLAFHIRVLYQKYIPFLSKKLFMSSSAKQQRPTQQRYNCQVAQPAIDYLASFIKLLFSLIQKKLALKLKKQIKKIKKKIFFCFDNRLRQDLYTLQQSQPDQQLTVLNSEIERLNTQLKSKTEELEKNRCNYNQFQSNESQRLKDLEQKNVVYSNEIDRLSNLVRVKINESEQYKQELVKLRDQSSKFNQIYNDNEKLTSLIRTLQDELDQLKRKQKLDESHLYNEKIQVLVQELDSWKTQFITQNREFHKNQELLILAQAELDSLKNKRPSTIKTDQFTESNNENKIEFKKNHTPQPSYFLGILNTKNA